MAKPPQVPLRRRLFGYAPAAVDAEVARLQGALDVARAEVAALQSRPDVAPEVAGHLAALLQSFAETVAEGQREAEERAAQIVAEAEERAARVEASALRLLDQANEMAATTEAEAAARVDEANSARRSASERIGAAVDRLSDALAALGEVTAPIEAGVARPEPSTVPLGRPTEVVVASASIWSTLGREEARPVTAVPHDGPTEADPGEGVPTARLDERDIVPRL